MADTSAVDLSITTLRWAYRSLTTAPLSPATHMWNRQLRHICPKYFVAEQYLDLRLRSAQAPQVNGRIMQIGK
ncbi:uncharacterized protein PHALS_08002 [Plasmopara halstedii]|uniref:Uncharacterized protein n=1 Tax=Plasmopara halstedii TaxID=4781 RepID=A0A0P1B8K8_PLAHL|nr:uncharacterized protein PHALS_08002 [Plasmopara halstedii]CEG50280.1 hypothetical protein PHALS_08002 [Plasmopara halstedii]|eukprot:XP_024586649.1 hypothetical protein PHALS_08002 [Plasmopara halstedii]